MVSHPCTGFQTEEAPSVEECQRDAHARFCGLPADEYAALVEDLEAMYADQQMTDEELIAMAEREEKREAARPEIGVNVCGRKFEAVVYVNGKAVKCGRFGSEENAWTAAQKAAAAMVA